jgi:hypothetical protein
VSKTSKTALSTRSVNKSNPRLLVFIGNLLLLLITYVPSDANTSQNFYERRLEVGAISYNGGRRLAEFDDGGRVPAIRGTIIAYLGGIRRPG